MSESAPQLDDFMPGGALGPKAPDAPAADLRPNLVGMDRADMAAALTSLGLPAYRSGQVFQWVYNRGVTDFDAMTNLSKSLRGELAGRFRIARPQVSDAQQSVDGTRKWLVRFSDSQEAETVYIPEPDRGTLCISSQIGCTLTCSFCHTGTQKLVRNLEPGEILGQLMLARDALGEWPASQVDRRLTNIVMMGMGEPLYNFDNVKKALNISLDGEGIAISRRKITLSTSGVVPMIRRAGEEIGVMLAISLHAVRDEVRDVLVPINRKWPIAELLAACRDYPTTNNARRITFEYVMLKDINDSDADARELARLLKGIPSKVNLIPFNPWPGSAYECSDDARIQHFADLVNRAGYVSTVRTPRGRDILAACGQLKSESVRERRARA
jgi:23S rRNA (adenine2503-C2)-methyltransferase